MAQSSCQQTGRWDNQAGIAIGPILFIIAILGILAAAIAAGSGSFTATTGTDSNKTKAAGLIEVGESLKLGMDRLTIESGATPSGSTAWSLDPTNTSGTYSLFSPTGGGIAPPSTALAANPQTDSWHIYSGLFPGLGTGGSNLDYLAVLNINSDVCNQVNNKAGVASTVAAALLTNDTITGEASNNLPNLIKVPSDLTGKTLGCFGDLTLNQYYFYEVIYIQ